MQNQMPRRNRFSSLLAGLAMLLVSASPDVTLAAETLTYYHWDALGSPVAATNYQGNVVWREEYKPYGERIKNEPTSQANTRWYTGHPHDTATGLTYTGARYYDPAVGRFMGVDPKSFTEGNPHSFNRYAYANNNPYSYIDPDGRDNVAVVTSSRASTPSDISSWRGQYTVSGYTVYHVPNGTPAWAASTVGRLFGEVVGSFEISWDAKSAEAGNRGTVLGDSSRTAEVSLGGGKHPIHVTDVGRAKEDALTQESGGNTMTRTGIRLHSGGPYGSTGCGATCDARSKGDTESSLISNMPALRSPDERTLIGLPAQGN
jgi:RHS repeat-associated protein